MRSNSHLDSPVFEEFIALESVRLRLYTRSRDDPRFMAIYVHFESASHAHLKVTIKFILLDQSKNQPRRDHTESCSGKMSNSHGYLGVDRFIENKCILQDDNQHVSAGSVRFHIEIQRTPEARS